MPVIPTFNPRVDLAGAYLGGQRIKLGREQLAQEAASDAARIALGREQLQQAAVANEMKLAAEKDILSREALQKAQEAEIEKSYKETQFGLERRRLEDDERNTKMKLDSAARGLEAEQGYSRDVSSGMPADVAARKWLVGRPGFGPAMDKLQVGPPREPASDRTLKYKILKAAKDDVAMRFAGNIRSPEYAAAIKDIDAKIEALFQNQQQAPALAAPPGVMAAPPTPRFQGPLPAPKIFMGTPQAPQFNVPPPAAVAPPAAAAPSQLPTVTTKAQYDALDKGAVYIGEGGKKYRKP